MAATDLYPDLRTLPPRDIHFANNVDVTGTDGGGTGLHNVVRFTNTVWNAGQGDMVVRGDIDPATKTGPGYQRIYNSAGGFTEQPAGSFKWHGGNHNHFHYENWGHYELWTAAHYDAWIAGGRQNAMISDTGSKTTSCVLDEEFISDIAGTRPWQSYGFSGCLAQNGSDGHDLLEGMSVGWGDTYDSWRDDQWIDLGAGGHLSDGDYVLRSVTDPDNQIYESPNKSDASREAPENNDAATRFTVSGGQIVDTKKPTGSVMVNSLASSTNNPTVTVDVIGRDDVSGVDSFRISNDGSHWSNPSRYADDDNPSTALTEGSTFVERPWNLADAATGGDATTGTKTVFVEFHDESGKWGDPVAVDIALDGPGQATRYSNAVRSDSPVALWRMNDAIGALTMADDLAAHSGVYHGSPAQGVDGLLGAEPGNHAVSFDGSDDNGEYPGNGADPGADFNLTNDLTVEAWIKPDTLPGPGGFATVVAKPESYALQFNGAKLEFTVIGADHGIDNGRHRLQADTGVIQAGRAYHVAGTFDGSTQRLYVNGVLVASQALNVPADITTNPIFVGSWSGGEHFDGTIDEAAIYPSALTAARLRAHYDAGSPDPQPPAAPSALTAAAQGTTSIRLTWHDNATDESSYALQRSTDASFNSGVSTLNIGQDQTSWTDTGLDPDTTYHYRLRARNPVGYSAFSATVSAKTDAPAAPPPDPPATHQEPETTTPTTPIAPVPPDPGPTTPAPPAGTDDVAPPTATVTVPAQELARVLADGLKQHVRSSEAGTVKLRVLVPKSAVGIKGSGRTSIGTLTVRITKPGHSTTVAVKLSRFARSELKRRGKAVRFLVEATAADAHGNTAKVVRAGATVKPIAAERRRR